MKYLAIDHGTKRIGLAVCDPREIICSPLAVLDKPEATLPQIIDIINEQKIEAVVIGLPLNMDGTKGHQAELVEKFAKHLQEKVDLPIHFFDERLSSFAAKEKMASIETKKSARNKPIDAIAAAEILESFLQHKNA